MPDYKVKLGLCPVRRDVTARPGIFNWEFAEERGRKIVDYIKENRTLEGVEFVDVLGVNPVDVVVNSADAKWVSERFKAEGVDGVLFILANFSNEEAIYEIAREMKIPVCIWAPFDDYFAPDGMRMTDSQCGLFGVSRILQRGNIPFSYIETSPVESETFARGLELFANVTCMVKNFRDIRVAQVGLRPAPFYSVICNEGELMQKFNIRTIPVNIGVVVDRYNKILAERQDELEEGAKLLKSRYEFDDITPPLLTKVYAFVLLYKDIFRDYRVDAVSAECWTAMQLAVGAMPCTAYSILADMGYIVGCESDMHGTLTMLLLSCATRGRKTPIFGEFTVRNPENKNSNLIWHCGPFAYSMKDPACRAKNVNMRQWFKVKDGLYTIARLDQEKGEYSIFNTTLKTTSGPYTFGTYLWGEFSDMSKLERKLVEGPYIHHCAEVEGDYTAEIAEFCKYLPAIENDPFEKVKE